MADNSIQERASGAVMGALIGDALALGPHWYYDLDELRRDFGDWIEDYTDPKPVSRAFPGVFLTALKRGANSTNWPLDSPHRRPGRRIWGEDRAATARNCRNEWDFRKGETLKNAG